MQWEDLYPPAQDCRALAGVGLSSPSLGACSQSLGVAEGSPTLCGAGWDDLEGSECPHQCLLDAPVCHLLARASALKFHM